MSGVHMIQQLLILSTRNRPAGGWPGLGSAPCTKGFTLVELLVVVAIFGIVIGASYTVFVRVYISQEEVVAAQQEARTALEILSREIRMAGLIAEENQPGGLSPLFNGAYGGSSAAPIELASRDDVSKTTTLAFKSDLDGFDLDNNGQTDDTEAVRYIYYHSDHPNVARRNTLTRQLQVWSGGAWTDVTGEQLFIENIDDLKLIFELIDGTQQESPANPSNIRGVNIEITARTEHQVEPYEGGKATRYRSLHSCVQIRNMGL